MCICAHNAVFFSKIKIIKEKLYSRVLELRIALVSRFEDIDFDHHLTKPNSMLEWKLLAMLDKNPELVQSINFKRHNPPLFQDVFDVYLDRFS